MKSWIIRKRVWDIDEVREPFSVESTRLGFSEVAFESVQSIRFAGQ